MNNENLKLAANKYPELEQRAHDISIEIMRRMELSEIDPHEDPEHYPDSLTESYLINYDIIHEQVFGHLYTNSDVRKITKAEQEQYDKDHEFVFMSDTI